ncbi:MAG TPA: glycogen debranching protein GlgX [Acetobacteraceae bacterium]|jgi:glycogen operon protein|nr:glycogen debranching protein GlgX [Acetobacteraceae bacterium]
MRHPPDRLQPGRPYPLGATWDGLGINFAVFSAHAEHIDLCLFEPSGRHEIARFRMPEYTDEVWHGYLPDASAGLLYGYRAHGPYDPERGHRFNHHKLLLDPYARGLFGNLHWSDTLYGFRLNSSRADLSFDRRDNVSAMMKSVVTDDSFNWGDDSPPRIPWPDTVIYEAHLRGLTMLHPAIRGHARGTFAGLAHAEVIDHLRRLGITAIELMPVHAFIQDRPLEQRGLRNYWGYNTVAFFAPERSYLSEGSHNELRVAVRRLHEAGIEVILDVVYNHTAETDELGPTLSFRGLDNASYYWLEAADRRRPVNDTGTGNTLNLSHPRVLQMVMDSLRYWVNSYHIDGFRFDLSATLGREAHGYDPGCGFFDALRQDPQLAGVKLIAEPWDVGPGGYQLGNHPPRFAQWNDRHRDTIRRYWRGDPGQRPELAARLAGSADIFSYGGRRPWASINYAAAHDGFTLNDLVSYVDRHNEANRDSKPDGHPTNFSSNWGAEGPTDDPSIEATRARVKRALLATVFLSAGTPMLLAGDEFGRTQQGNNNAYCQDNEISWVDWHIAASPSGRALIDYVARLIALRREHPILRCKVFLHGKEHPAPDIADIAWFDETGGTISAAAWNDREQRTLTLRRADKNADGKVSVLTLLLNPTAEARDFRLPPPLMPFQVLIDSATGGTAEDWRDTAGLSVAAHSAMLLYSQR